jgi:aspartate kinase
VWGAPMIVMKFGGTSVESAEAIERVSKIVRSRIKQSPLVVVSAMAKVTDQLVAMGNTAASGDSSEALASVEALRERHQQTAKALLGENRAAALAPKLQAHFIDLENFVRGLAAVRELTPRGSDYLLSFGELLSSLIVADAFIVRGVTAAWVDSRECLVTDTTHTRAVPLLEETREKSKRKIGPLLAKKRTPVMGGFIAASTDGIPTTLGRGGSDYSAAIMGAALNADKIEIWTDVEGMMTTDPRLCSGARTIKQISFNEAAELAYFGAKVLHPLTLLPAIHQNVVASRGVGVHGFLRSVFEAMDRHAASVDIVAISEVSMSFTIETRRLADALIKDLEQIADVNVDNDQAVICLVGEDIHGKPGIAASVFNTVAEAQVNIRMISQGASEINISFVVKEDDVPRVVRHLHDHFFPLRARKKNGIRVNGTGRPGKRTANHKPSLRRAVAAAL